MSDEMDLLIKEAVKNYMKDETKKTKEELEGIEMMFYHISEKNKKKLFSNSIHNKKKEKK